MRSNHTSNEVVLLVLFLNSFSLSQNKRFKPFCAGWRTLLESHSKLWQPYRRKKNTTWCALNNQSFREILTQKRASVGWESPFWGWQWILAESGWLCSSRFLSSSAAASVVPPQTLHPKGREERRESRSACLDSHANMSVLCTSKKCSTGDKVAITGQADYWSPDVLNCNSQYPSSVAIGRYHSTSAGGSRIFQTCKRRIGRVWEQSQERT